MGASKSEFFSEEHNEIAILFKAMSHPARVAIVDYLLSVDTCICGDIVSELPLAQPTVSQHLKELKMPTSLKERLREPQYVIASTQKPSKKLKSILVLLPSN